MAHTNGIPAGGFKNLSDSTQPGFSSIMAVHGKACREVLQGFPSGNIHDIAGVIQSCEEMFPLLKEFRNTCPELDRKIEDLFILTGT